MFYGCVKTPIGWLLLAGSEQALQMVRFPRRCTTDAPQGTAGLDNYFDLEHSKSRYLSTWEKAKCSSAAKELYKEATNQFTKYFDGKLSVFELPLDPFHTVSEKEFRKQVWAELVRIPYGETLEYGQVAANLGNPDASQAVGGANASNPLPILMPCHRVVGKDGKLTGYTGGICRQGYLIGLECPRKDKN